MSGILSAWKDCSLLQKFGILTASSLTAAGAVFVVYKLKTKEPDRPPRAETPVRRVDHVEEETIPKQVLEMDTAIKIAIPSEESISTKESDTCPKQSLETSISPAPISPVKLPCSETTTTQSPMPLNLSEFEPSTLKRDHGLSPREDMTSSVASCTASFEHISLPQSSVGQDVASPPSLGFSPSHTSTTPLSLDTSLGSSSGSASFVKLSMPDEKEQKEVVKEEEITIEKSADSFTSAPVPSEEMSHVKESSSADVSNIEQICDEQTQEEEEEEKCDDIEGLAEQKGLKEYDVMLLNEPRADDEASQDGTTMATIGSDSERNVEDDDDDEDVGESENDENESDMEEQGEADDEREEESNVEEETPDEPVAALPSQQQAEEQEVTPSDQESKDVEEHLHQASSETKETKDLGDSVQKTTEEVKEIDSATESAEQSIEEEILENYDSDDEKSSDSDIQAVEEEAEGDSQRTELKETDENDIIVISKTTSSAREPTNHGDS